MATRAAPLWQTEQDDQDLMWKIDALLKAKTTLEVPREHLTIADLAQRYQGHPNRRSS
jgi:hypothetical protein